MSLGFRTLLAKEIRRFMKVPGQTVFSPLLTTVLYFVVFGFSLGAQLREIHGVPYVRFIVPGLVMLGAVNNSFLNTASSLFVAKIQGTVVDLLVAPIRYGEILAAFVLGALVRGLLVGGLMWIVAGLFTTFHLAHPLWAATFLVLVCTFFGTAGLLVAIWADKFEQINIVPAFVVTPLTFLGGVFYSVDMLPETFRRISLLNPILYMVEGLRFGVIGASDVSPWLGLALVGGLNVAAMALAYVWLRSGYRLRS